ncbi:hypothetical protein JTB14_006746 [Gonioctena quinquepunctata]|nr:hypothetical protein JTB14_006746 [Gonioctena quinquepunctata]
MPCKLNDLKEVYQNEDLRLKFLDGDHRTLDEGERYCISAKKNWKINRAITNKKEKNRSDNVDAIGKKQLTGKRNMEKALHLKDRLNGSNVFSTLDESKGFLQVALDEERSYLCSFATPFGRYRFLRFPYGLTCAQICFKNEGVNVYIDDIIIAGKKQEEHDRRLEEVLEKAAIENIRLNKMKCSFSIARCTECSKLLRDEWRRPAKKDTFGNLHGKRLRELVVIQQEPTATPAHSRLFDVTVQGPEIGSYNILSIRYRGKLRITKTAFCARASSPATREGKEARARFRTYRGNQYRSE